MNTVHSYLFWLLSTLVFASPDDTRARQLYQNGVLLYDEGSYEEALLAFQEAYTLSKRHALLYNMSKTLVKMERYEEAIDALKKYRVYAPLKKQNELQQEGRDLVVLLEAQQARQREENEERQKQESLAKQEALRQQEEAEKLRQQALAREAVFLEKQAQQRRLTDSLRYGGGAVALIGGGIAITSFALSRNQIENFDKAGYESLQPINHAGIAIAIIGAGSAVGSLFVPKTALKPEKKTQEP